MAKIGVSWSGWSMVALVLCALLASQMQPAEAWGRVRFRVPSIRISPPKIPTPSFWGSWGSWASWSSCTKNCGSGSRKRSRTRRCSNPIPVGNAWLCPGSNIQSQTSSCNTHGCPVNGNWGGWGGYTGFGSCSKPCGGGTQTRSRRRSCNSPAPKNGGKGCSGSSISYNSRSCNTHACPVNGKWGAWGGYTGFGSCNKPCGGGTQTRSRRRSCNNPAPKNGGKGCSGSSISYNSRSCNTQACPVNGKWGAWGGYSAFGPCTKPCGGGQQLRSRRRSCNNPAPKYGGKTCSGSFIALDTKSCNTQKCPVNGGWGNYGSWTTCSKSCGPGTQYRTRACNKPTPAYGGKSCSGASKESRPCLIKPCPVHGDWGKWKGWTVCSAACGPGTQTRIRACDSPAPLYGGKLCAGAGKETRRCQIKPCPVHGGWGDYGTWSACSKPCNLGSQTRKRLCDKPTPAHGGKSCSGTATQSRPCMLKPCPVDGGWGDWFKWTPCSKACGPGTQTRSRTCTKPIPLFGGKPCSGTSKESRPCNLKPCPVDGDWGKWKDWTVCSAACGPGTQTRTRACDSPAPLYGGKLCVGTGKETRKCQIKPCPVHGDWGKWKDWTVCSAACGPGTQTRIRACDSPAPLYGGKLCVGAGKETRKCQVKPCPVHGDWGKWKDWTVCSAACGPGTQTRTRACDSPAPLYGGKLCAGASKETRKCQIKPCPVDGGWGNYGAWTVCSKPCGLGGQTRTRACDKPAPAHGGKPCKGPTTQSQSCMIKRCPVDGGWGDWQKWTTCSKLCGPGTQTRSRACDSPTPAWGGKGCVGALKQSRTCTIIPCPVHGDWGQWEDWTVCSKSCGPGTQTRARACDSPAPLYGGRQCSGASKETQKCQIKPCPVNGGWGAYGLWTKCSKDCGPGTQTRSRACDSPAPAHGGLPCSGATTESQTCMLKPCPVHGGWGKWKDWTTCSKSCGPGTQTRARACDSPSPAHGGRPCSGATTESRTCTIKPCPVHGGWGDFDEWTTCSKPCGPGTQTRARACNKPTPAHGGKLCSGSATETRACTIKPCPVHGGWSTFDDWTTCSKPCGPGTQTRTRACNKPTPAHGGNPCSGGATESRACTIKPCPVHGGWGDFDDWTTCSKPCGPGTQTRTRACNKPTPAHGGNQCSGSATESRACSIKPCPVHGGWGDFDDWTTCSKPCGPGTQTRKRACDKPTPAHGGNPCSGSATESRACTIKPCPVHGGWGDFDDWTTCSKPCGPGTQTRARACNKPTPAHGGNQCSGSATESRACTIKPCPVHGGWGDFDDWTTCSKPCGPGTQTRTRACNKPTPAHGGNPCSGSATESQACTIKPCPVDGAFGAWDEWTTCSKPCGPGTQTRARKCDSPAPAHGGKTCVGEITESRTCTLKPCPVDGGWGDWDDWTTCSKPCGTGTQTRQRACDSPPAAHGGKTCSGSNTESRTCTIKPCPVDGDWSDFEAWGPCSKKCGGGQTVRSRTCTKPSPAHGGKDCVGSASESKPCNTNACPTPAPTTTPTPAPTPAPSASPSSNGGTGTGTGTGTQTGGSNSGSQTGGSNSGSQTGGSNSGSQTGGSNSGSQTGGSSSGTGTETVVCTFGQYACKDNTTCIESVQVCDGKQDCKGGEDEHMCAAQPDMAAFASLLGSGAPGRAGYHLGHVIVAMATLFLITIFRFE